MQKGQIKIEEWTDIPKEARPRIRYWLPGAAVEKDDLRQEIQLLKERGFGGVEIADAMKFSFVSRSEDGWGTENWNQVLKTVGDTTMELGMAMDVTNGPLWPISSPAIKNADEPGAGCELTYGVTVCQNGGYYRGELPERKVIHKEGRPVLIQVLAYQEREEKILLMDSFLDLNGWVKDKGDVVELEGTLPEAQEGCRWLIFAFYRQPTGEKAGSTPYYVIDHFSEEGVKACEQYWTTVMEKLGNLPSMESFFCDSLEYHASLEWTPAFPEEFLLHRGYSILPFLPFIGRPRAASGEKSSVDQNGTGYRAEDPKLVEMIQADYAEVLTQCFCEKHLAALERMAEKFGKTVRYQVAYNKPMEVERSALYVAIPENEALGRVSMDVQRTMAAAAHLGRKKRYSFECAAEYTNAYGQDQEDLMWWVKRSQMAGMNAQVLHGASYSGSCGKWEEVLPGFAWPGFEAFRKAVSNYWNRTLSVEDTRECMDTIARTNAIFQKKAKVDCAIYRESFLDDGLGSEFCIYEDNGMLSKNGYSYETVSTALLELPVCRVDNHELDAAGVGYRCLIIPRQEAVCITFLYRVQKLMADGLPVIWLGKRPFRSIYYGEWRTIEQRERWERQMKLVWNHPDLIHLDSAAQVPNTLLNRGIYPRIQVENVMESGDIVTATRVDEERRIRYYAVYGYNRVVCTPDAPDPKSMGASAFYQRETVKGHYRRPGEKSQRTIRVKLEGEGAVYLCNPWNGRSYLLNFTEESGYMRGAVSLEEDEMVLLAVFEGEKAADETVYRINAEKGILECIPLALTSLELEDFQADTPSEFSFLRSHYTGNRRKIALSQLLPWHELENDLEAFAGRGIYFGTVRIDSFYFNRRYVLKLTEVSDTFRVWVNGHMADFPDQVLKEVDITELLREGENHIEIVVTANLYNRLVGAKKDEPDLFFRIPIPYEPKRYGICGECCLEVYEAFKINQKDEGGMKNVSI